MSTSWTYFPSPIGLLRAEASARGLTRVQLVGAPTNEVPGPGRAHLEVFLDFAERYFAGEPIRYAGTLDLENATPAQARLWRFVQEIPYGRTQSYAQVGRTIGLHPRAVGAGMRSCPFLLVVPAHRVIHADGRIGGFAGHEGVKAWLLHFEQANRPSGTS
ncbi:methylated-DNA--[protein]-cysteine S-methyltransferase [Oceanithermus sp.]